MLFSKHLHESLEEANSDNPYQAAKTILSSKLQRTENKIKDPFVIKVTKDPFVIKVTKATKDNPKHQERTEERNVLS